MSDSGKAKVDDMLPTESHKLCEEKIHMIRTAMEALVYGAEKVSSTKERQFRVHLNRTLQGATTWSDADGEKAIVQLERKIHHVTPAKRKLFDKLLQYHKQQLWQEVGTIATGPRSIFANVLGLMTTAAEDETNGVAKSPLTSDCNSRSAHPMLRQKPRPGVYPILSMSLSSWRERLMASPGMEGSDSRRISPSA